jgi:phosphoglycolate phosphatase
LKNLVNDAALRARAAIDWTKIDLVIFDVDGTLYDQRKLRLVMLRELAAHALKTRSLKTIQTLRTFRHVREALGEQPGADFMHLQYAQTAAHHGTSIEAVRAMSMEWLEERPLPFLAACRYPHLQSLFTALRAGGKQIAAFSDYPAKEKLKALGLQAAPVVCATDLDIARLKPDPLGLQMILKRCGVQAERTLMIGDRFDRDGAAAERAGVRALIRTSASHPEFATFSAYDDAVFEPLLADRSRTATA